LFGRGVARAIIAAFAAGDEVVPVRAAAARFRENVIERQFRRVEDLAAILAGVMVAEQDVFARKALALEWNVDVFGQTDDRRRGYLGGRRWNFVLGAFFGAGDAFQNQDDRPPHRANVDRLIGRVQDEYSAIHRNTS